MMTHAVGKLKGLTGGSSPAVQEHDDEIYELLDKLHKVLKHIEPRYK
jgi:hypothetical protein